MAENKKIRVAELEFDEIKSNLKNFLRQHPEFTDYDFEGSNLSILIDLLAYNTHYNAIMANMAFNESFMSSATLRSSIVDRAKELGYTPRSKIAPTATVSVQVNSPAGTPASLTMEKNTPFGATVDGTTYTFYTLDKVITTPDDLGRYVFNNVTIKEGTPLSTKYNVTNDTKTFRIPNKDVDTTSLIVRVQENSGSTKFEIFSLGEDVSNANGTTPIYFLTENSDGFFEVSFGDGVIGKPVIPGNIVYLDYIVTKGSAANGARGFTIGGSIQGNSDVIVFTMAPAIGGSDTETADDIKFKASKNYGAKGRVVTSDDYKAILPQLYPNIRSLSVWGGEDNDPPIYGKVFICIRPLSGEFITTLTKETIKNSLLRDKNVVTVIPEIVDPEYIRIVVDTKVYYDPNKTEKSGETLSADVKQAIINFNSTELDTFGSMFRYSKLGRAIDDTDKCISSNITTIKLEKDLPVTLLNNRKYYLKIFNPIYNEGVPEGAVSSSGFQIVGSEQTHYIEDDGVGNLRMYYYVSANVKYYVNTTLGTVDYNTGSIVINELNVLTASNTDQNTITFTFTPHSNDVVPVRNNIVHILDSDITVESIVDNTVSGYYSGNTNYKFSKSR